MSRYYQDLRFEKTYGLPAGRRRIAITSLENQYRIIKVIDKGGELGTFNAGVFLVENLQEKKLRVLKRIPPTTQMLEREILFLQVLNHPNIVGYRDAFITNDIPKSMGLYLEYCDGGSLADLINKYVEHNRGQAHRPPAYVPEAFAWHAIHSLANALQFIHHGIKSSDRRNPPVPMDPKNWPIILHRDLKPANIFLHYFPVPHGTRKRALLYPHGPFNHANPEYSMTTYPKLVLADFGLATQYDEPDFPDVDHFVGTVQWSPPELPETTARGEIWTLGAVILSLCRLLPSGPLFLFPPSPLPPDIEKWMESPEARKGVRDVGPGSSYSAELRGVLKSCLRYNKHNRPLSYELMIQIREGEENMIGSGRIPITPLPRWVSE